MGGGQSCIDLRNNRRTNPENCSSVDQAVGDKATHKYHSPHHSHSSNNKTSQTPGTGKDPASKDEPPRPAMMKQPSMRKTTTVVVTSRRDSQPSNSSSSDVIHISRPVSTSASSVSQVVVLTPHDDVDGVKGGKGKGKGGKHPNSNSSKATSTTTTKRGSSGLPKKLVKVVADEDRGNSNSKSNAAMQSKSSGDASEPGNNGNGNDAKRPKRGNNQGHNNNNNNNNNQHNKSDMPNGDSLTVSDLEHEVVELAASPFRPVSMMYAAWEQKNNGNNESNPVSCGCAPSSIGLRPSIHASTLPHSSILSPCFRSSLPRSLAPCLPSFLPSFLLPSLPPPNLPTNYQQPKPNTPHPTLLGSDESSAGAQGRAAEVQRGGGVDPARRVAQAASEARRVLRAAPQDSQRDHLRHRQPQLPGATGQGVCVCVCVWLWLWLWFYGGVGCDTGGGVVVVVVIVGGGCGCGGGGGGSSFVFPFGWRWSSNLHLPRSHFPLTH